MVIVIDHRLRGTNDESMPLHPMTIIGTEIVTMRMIEAVTIMLAALKRRSESILPRRRKDAAGVIVSLRVVIIRPRHDGIIVIVTVTVSTPHLRAQNEIRTSEMMIRYNNLQVPVVATIATTEVIEMTPKKVFQCHKLRRVEEIF